MHVGVKFKCNQCDYEASQRSNLSLHIQHKHEGIEYFCTECEYRAPYKHELKKHHQLKHGDTQYLCNECEYQAWCQSSLKSHIQSKHEGKVYLVLDNANPRSMRLKDKLQILKQKLAEDENTLSDIKSGNLK